MKKIILTACVAAALTACQSEPQYDATGIFEATTVTVSSEVSGKILALDIEEGDSIVSGTNIGAIDTTALMLQRKQLQSQMSAIENSRPDVGKQIESLRRQIAQQQHECNRIANLLKDGAATRKQSDDAEAMLGILNGQLDALLSSLGKNTASLSDNAVAVNYQIEQIDDRIDKSSIAAPITGTVLAKYAEPGEFAQVGRQLFKVADMNDVYIRAYFTSSQLASIRLGQSVTVVADFGGDEHYDYPGTITWIAEESEFTPKNIQTNDSRANLVYAVKIKVANDGRLKLGMYGGVKL